jgi:hypothetical protein
VTASAGAAGATLQVIEQARRKMGLPEVDDADSRPLSADDAEPRSTASRNAAGGVAGPGAAAGGDGVRAGGSVGSPDALAGD